MGIVREAAERFYRLFGEGDLDGAYSDFADDCISITPSGPLTNEGHLNAARTLKTAVPDGHMDLLRVLEVGDEVYVTGRFRGTHTGDFSNPQGTIVASGNEVDLFFTDYMRVVDGRIVECEAVWDRLTLVAQLGGAGVAQDIGHLPTLLVKRQ